MKKQKVTSFFNYLELVTKSKTKATELLLFRGQSESKPLIPSIARDNPESDTTDLEKKMLEELIRRTKTKLNSTQFDEWDWLVYAQHFGMKTRLLDWTSNPLTALWFACSNEFKKNNDSFVYILKNADTFLLDKQKESSPFNRTKTRVLKPTLNNDRIIAQAGWFTAHKYSKGSERFVDLRTNIDINTSITELTIPKNIKSDVLENLNVFGINSQTLFPEISGICKHLNWEFTKK
ncbi:MAG: FRG domain-containing protein [Bacteroidales bacterium]|nr:FRG domain-containing protein [Bacteroidales bacterium]